MANVYIPDAVWQVVELHKELLIEYPGEWSVRFVLEKQAQRLKEAYDDQDPARSLIWPADTYAQFTVGEDTSLSLGTQIFNYSYMEACF